MAKQNVLFLCTGNSARSQMAEAILRKQAGERFEVFSAGIEPKGLHPLTLRVMREAGYDLSGQTSKSLSVYAGKIQFDYLITVCAEAEKNCPYFSGQGIRLHWFFEDPAAAKGDEEEVADKFRRTRAAIEAKITSWLMESQPD